MRDFPKYQKAIPFLTISEEEKLKAENLILKTEKSKISDLKKELLSNKETIQEFKELMQKIKSREIIPKIQHPDPIISKESGFILKNHKTRLKFSH